MEIYELMSNLVQRPPHVILLNQDWTIRLAEKMMNWTYLSKEYMLKHKVSPLLRPI